MVNHFLHAGHLHIEGLKMSKSLKNFTTISEGLQNYSANQIRILFLLNAWDKPMNFSDTQLQESAAKEKQLLKDYSKAQRKLVVAAADPLQMNQIDGSVQTMRERYPFIKMPSLWNGGERVEEEEDEDEEEDEEVVFERRKSSRTARIRSPQPRSTKK